LRRNAGSTKIEFGDWQTPAPLARKIVELLGALGVRPASVVEPTCGRGAFLEAAASVFPGARLFGFDVNPSYVEAARAALADRSAEIDLRDFFQVDWEKLLGEVPGPVLVLGNPPWVTSADLGALGSTNLPRKTNFLKFTGLDAITGKANFDVSEWMLIRLLASLVGRDFSLAMLCKAAVARRLLRLSASEAWPYAGAIRRIDARAHFNAAVDAVLLFVCPSPGGEPAAEWPVFDEIDALAPTSSIGVCEGRICADIVRFRQTRSFEGTCQPPWRSGLKHDCARVMEFDRKGEALVNGLGEQVEIEEDYIFPLLKGSDVANRRAAGRKFVLVPQRALGDDTLALRDRAPKTFAYLERHAALLEARKSSIYKDKPPFSVFGIGEYTFSPYKVAVCGLYKRLDFSLVEPHAGRPVVLDDTCYFLSFTGEPEARAAARALQGEAARSFFEARVFWDEKRPIHKALLQSLSLEALTRGTSTH